MDISKLSTLDKSALLAKAMGWKKLDIYGGWVRPEQANPAPYGRPLPDFYDPANMALAWKVLNWAYLQQVEPFRKSFKSWWEWNMPHWLLTWGPEEAQAQWLDKVLGLAIDTGLVELHEEGR